MTAAWKQGGIKSGSGRGRQETICQRTPWGLRTRSTLILALTWNRVRVLSTCLQHHLRNVIVAVIVNFKLNCRIKVNFSFFVSHFSRTISALGKVLCREIKTRLSKPKWAETAKEQRTIGRERHDGLLHAMRAFALWGWRVLSLILSSSSAHSLRSTRRENTFRPIYWRACLDFGYAIMLSALAVLGCC